MTLDLSAGVYCLMLFPPEYLKIVERETGACECCGRFRWNADSSSSKSAAFERCDIDTVNYTAGSSHG